MSLALVTVQLEAERDVVLARQRARQIAEVLGFDTQDQTRIATAVSEIARNAVRYAAHGRVEFSVEGTTPPQLLLVRVSDRGSGIAKLSDVLEGRYRSATGMGMGITGSRRLMDGFEIESGPRGTVVVLKKLLPRSAPFLSRGSEARIVEELARQPSRDVFAEVERQNQELMATLDDLRHRQDELVRLNRELEDTNRGVLALYAELDEKADHLRRADHLKTRFLSDMSHEFRTPLNSIRALTGLLHDRADGPLTEEQERQVVLVRQSADQLLDLVNDLLDLAKVQAGKVVVRPAEFRVQDLFAALRGMLRPLLVSDRVDLEIEAPDDLPAVFSDEGKVSQILRNLISNALKFTEDGRVQVSARPSSDGRETVLEVSDTGIGIAPEDQDKIFEEYGQIENPVQHRVRGTGLGLPLSKKLATLLGGSLTVRSEMGRGSIFTLRMPTRFEERSGLSRESARPAITPRPLCVPVLVVEDDAVDRMTVDAHLRGTRFQPIPVTSTHEARAALESTTPAAIVLDILLRGEESWKFMTELKADEFHSHVPILVVTTVADERKTRALGADRFFLKPIARTDLLDALCDATGQSPDRARRVLVIDDDHAFRYALRRTLEHLGCEVSEAEDGDGGLQRARESRPELVFLDLRMPVETGDGARVWKGLRRSPETAATPVAMVSSQAAESGPWTGDPYCTTFVSKDELSADVVCALLESRSLGLADGPRATPLAS